GPLADRRVHEPARRPEARVMNVAIAGLGLIGGSIAIDLRRGGLARRLTGVEADPGHAAVALELGLVDAIQPLEQAVADADVVILALPVDALRSVLPRVLDQLAPGAIAIDTGSTKAAICAAVSGHPRRARFVAAHPIAGTENSGPRAALAGLFSGRMNIVCERERSSAGALETAMALFDALEMRTTFMEPDEHDRHLAYVSHLSHVSSFLLGQTVLDIEKDEKNIFLLAGSGFASTVRLAKSAPSTWVPIFQQNAAHLTRALDEYIAHLVAFRDALDAADVDGLRTMTGRANEIRRVLDDLTAPKRLAGEVSPLAAAAEGRPS
ncbi:MAG TPA: prephenate dehydrogenase, partial [Thermoanaerobaculia bacterium]|nr:prephenate dehydrogenase [Thermoanaerobaculia bacterium]